jgi:hypothetical protein
MTSKLSGKDSRPYTMGSTCGAWVKELNTLFKLKGGRKTGENPDEWMRKAITTTRGIMDNLGDINLSILAAYLITVDIGEDLTATITQTYRQPKWPSLDTKHPIKEKGECFLVRPNCTSWLERTEPREDQSLQEEEGRKVTMTIWLATTTNL